MNIKTRIRILIGIVLVAVVTTGALYALLSAPESAAFGPSTALVVDSGMSDSGEHSAGALPRYELLHPSVVDLYTGYQARGNDADAPHIDPITGRTNDRPSPAP